MTLIGITGYARHGKDTLAGVLVRDFGYYRISFADPLKQLLYAMNPYVPHVASVRTLVDEMGWEEAKGWPEVRRLLQELGTAARNILGEDVWLRAAEKKMVEAAPQPVVIPDVRFPNEADFIRRHGGELWAVRRQDFDNGLGTDHESERHVAEIANRADRVFINADGIRELEALVPEALAWA